MWSFIRALVSSFFTIISIIITRPRYPLLQLLTTPSLQQEADNKQRSISHLARFCPPERCLGTTLKGQRCQNPLEKDCNGAHTLINALVKTDPANLYQEDMLHNLALLSLCHHHKDPLHKSFRGLLERWKIKLEQSSYDSRSLLSELGVSAQSNSLTQHNRLHDQDIELIKISS